ncbi:MAG: hypothetical protein V4537_14585 [Pseudomonadota bacterium]
MLIILPLLVCLVGLLMYCLGEPTRPKVSRVGFAMFWVGLLVTLWTSGGTVAHLLR